MAPKILQVNRIFYAVFATLGKPGIACRAAENIQESGQDASSPALGLSTFAAGFKSAAHIVLFIVKSASLNNRTTKGVGKMLFLMENVHCAAAGDTEQNDFRVLQ